MSAFEVCRCRWMFALPLLLLTAAPLSSQSPSPPTFHAGVSVVTLPVTVVDKSGHLVTGLTKDDFLLQEDGAPQTIKYFSLDTKLPLTLGLLIDTSGSVRSVLGEERAASQTFFQQMLDAPEDRAFLIHFDREVELLQDLTSSREKLEKGLTLLDAPEPVDSGTNDASAQDGQRRRHGGTLLYDAIFLAGDELLHKQSGRKAMIVLSDGVDRGSRETLQSAIEAAQRAETTVYAVYFKGEENHFGNGGGGGGGRRGGWPGGGRGGGFPGGGGGWPGGSGGGRSGRAPEPHVDGKKILEQIAGETGGRLFEVSKKQTVAQIYSSIEQELRSQYVLGFSPTGSGLREGFHPLQLTVKRKGAFVQTRSGFYAEPQSPESTTAKQQ